MMKRIKDWLQKEKKDEHEELNLYLKQRCIQQLQELNKLRIGCGLPPLKDRT